MRVLAVLATAAAAALLAAALTQAASLKKRLEELPPAPETAPGAVAFDPSQPPPSPYEMSELEKRVEALVGRIDGKVAREKKEFEAARERYLEMKKLSGESLALLDGESAAVKNAIGDGAYEKAKVAAMTKRIRTEQQKAMIRRFAGDMMRKENEKLKAELGLTPEQAAQFDKVAEEMMEKVADMGSSFMDGEMNMQGFQQLQKESNEKMGAILDEGQMTKYKAYQEKRWGGRGNGDQGQEGQPEGGK